MERRLVGLIGCLLLAWSAVATAQTTLEIVARQRETFALRFTNASNAPVYVVSLPGNAEPRIRTVVEIFSPVAHRWLPAADGRPTGQLVLRKVAPQSSETVSMTVPGYLRDKQLLMRIGVQYLTSEPQEPARRAAQFPGALIVYTNSVYSAMP